MAAERSPVENLLYRRVPQIVGMYIAASWLVIELGDWVTERFDFPPSVTSYVFVAMLLVLPAVILFAYNHGAPGDDKWTSAEKVAIPANVILAFGVLYFLSPQLRVEAATETVQIPDEIGVVRDFVVAREGFHKDVIGFFWRNDSGNPELDWLSYGLVLMLAQDMNRVSPVISVTTPFASRVARKELRSRDFTSFLDEPQGLQVQIARDTRSTALIVGTFSEVDDIRTIEATVIDARSGEILGTHTVTGSDWLGSVDDVSDALLDYLEIVPGPEQSNDPVSQHFSDSLQAIEHYTNGQVALNIHNDFPAAIAEFQKSVEVDPGFAEADGDLSRVHYLSGDVESARVTVSRALKNSYRLSDTSKFILKANRYMFDGNHDRAERVLEMWTEVQPSSTDAYISLARVARLRGGEDGLSRASAAYDRLLELKPNDYGIYQQKAEVEQQRGDFAAAARYLRTFLEFEPDSGDAHLQLANIYQAQGDLDAAQESLEDAAILSDDPMKSELGLARLEARRGFYDQAEQRLARQLTDDLGPQQRMMVLNAQTELAVATGQLDKSMSLLDEVDEIAKTVMPPMVRLVSVENQRVSMLLMQGDPEAALTLADEIVAQLQPPVTSYLNFTYTKIYKETGNREAFREWASKTEQAKEQIPEIMHSFVEMDSARLAVWDEDFDAAVNHLNLAKQILDRSLIQLMQDNLGASLMQVKLAELYLQARAMDEFKAQIGGVLRIFPADANAILVLAKGYIAEGEADAARQALNEALNIWSNADGDFVRLIEAQNLLASL